MKKTIKALRKIGVLLVGIPVLILGIILVPAPGPGLLVIVAGLFILSLEFEWAQKYLDNARAKLKGIYDHSKQRQQHIKDKQSDLIAFYGTLKKGQHSQMDGYMHKDLEYVGPCKIKGRLEDLGRLKGLKKGSEIIDGSLYKVVNLEIFSVLDEYEAIDNKDPKNPGFSRRLVKLAEPKEYAWVYFYNG